MKTLSQVMSSLEALGTAQTRKIYTNHGAPENMFGCKLGDLKPLAKKLKGQHELGRQLYDTENVDAMYLASLVVDPAQMDKTILKQWARKASWYLLSEYAVPGVTSHTDFAIDLANQWIRSKTAHVAACGWSTCSMVLGKLPADEWDLEAIEAHLSTIEATIHDSPNRVRYAMNGFVISVGGYIEPLRARAMQVAKSVGKVHVEMGNTSCKVPFAPDYIAKIAARR